MTASPIVPPEQWDLQSVFSGILTGVCLLFSVGAAGQARRAPATLRSSWHLRWVEQQSLQKLGQPAHPKLLLAYSLLSCSLPLLYHLLRILALVKSVWDACKMHIGLTGEGTTHAQNSPGQRLSHQTHRVSSFAVTRMVVSTQHRD